jgi:hypothetical protein
MERAAMAFEIPDHYSVSFTSNVELLLQQMDSRFSDCVGVGTYTGENAQVVKQFGEVEFQEKTSRLADTNFSEIEHRQRWVAPTDYDLALPVEREDEIRMLDSPTSAYVEAMTAAWNRKKDAVIMTGALGTAKTGKNGGTNTAFDTTNFSVAADFVLAGGAANSGLTIPKLTEAKRMLDAAECPESNRYFGHGSTQLQDLLNTTQITSADYNTVKALVAGEVDTFMGFKFKRYEGFAVASSVRSCVAWHKSGLHLGMWNSLETKIGERPDKKYLTQVFMKGTIGGTRTNEEKVVRVLCYEG